MIHNTKVKIILLLLTFAFTTSLLAGCHVEADSSQVVKVTNNGGMAGGSEDEQPTAASQDESNINKATVPPEGSSDNQTDEPTDEPAPTQNTLSGIDPDKPMVALTFDDGPHSPVTNRILDMVEEYDIKVTFFIVGNRLTGSNVESARRAYALGCELANHTWDHENSLKGMTRDQLYAALDPMDNALFDSVGVRTKLIRPVGGAYDENLLKAADRPFILWSVDTEDWKVRDKDAIFEHIKNETFDGAIILMHDIRVPTADACEMAIPWLIEQGYQLVTVSELFEARGIELEAGKVYSKAMPAPAATETPETQSPNIGDND